MPLIQTGDISPASSLSSSETFQTYCGLDTMVTLEVLEELSKTFNRPPEIYSFERALQAPYLEIMQRGFLVDDMARRHASAALRQRLTGLDLNLQRLARAVWGRGLNPRSPKQLAEFFYTAMHLPEVWINQKGVRKISTNREALEKLEEYLHARPFTSSILSIRDIGKQLDIFESEIDPDGRFRTSYNIAGTETGRPSSSTNAFGTGGNAQNIAPALRYIFTSDPGWKLCVIDLEQVEARDVGWFCGVLFGDWSFLDACECLSGDHQVLTKDGWVGIDSMPTVEIATWSEGEIIFEVPLRWNSGFSSNMVQIESASVSVYATYNHTMPVIVGKSNRIEKRTISQILSHPNFVAPNIGTLGNGGIFVAEAKLIAAFQADGTRDATGRVHWSFTKLEKINALQKMLEELDYKYSKYYLSSGAIRFYLHKGQGQEKWPKECGKEIMQWDVKTLKSFCWSHFLWDAHFEKSHVRITAKSKTHLEWLAVAYCLTGRATNITVHKKDYWQLTVRSNKNHQYRSAKINEFRGGSVAVFCPTVSSGYFLVKRNGKIFISGNSGDLHTNNAKLVWPELGWTGNHIHDREIANKLFYRDFSYRDFAKRGGHLSNYRGSAWMMARALKIPIGVAEEFQARYLHGRPGRPGRSEILPAFPCIPRWWQWVAEELQTTHQLVTPFGRRRHFFGRPGDDSTLREAIAFLPQSTTADRMNLGLWRVWHGMPEVQLLAQTYDSITFQYREDEPDVDGLIGRALELIRVELTEPGGRRYVVPGEAKIGWNWANATTAADVTRSLALGLRPPRLNPKGLLKWKQGKPDGRVRAVGLQRAVM